MVSLRSWRFWRFLGSTSLHLLEVAAALPICDGLAELLHLPLAHARVVVDELVAEVVAGDGAGAKALDCCS